MRQRLRQLVQRIRRAPGRRQEAYRPDFSDEALFACLAGSPRSLEEARARFHSGECDLARRLLIRHFRTRVAPRFFIEPRTMSEVVRHVRLERPEWVRATLARVRQDCDVGVPLYGLTGPRIGHAFARSIDVRAPSVDLLYPVRLDRFFFAPRLALAGLYDTPTTSELAVVLNQWVTAVRSGHGSCAYLSPFVAVCRSLALSWTWAFLAGLDGEELEPELMTLKIIMADAVFLDDHLGESIDNNHLLAESFALWYLATLFPEFSGAARWRDRGESVWLKELRRQIYEDGTTFEHSVHYHELACEMAAAYVLLARRNDCKVPDWVDQRVKKMLGFQASLGGREGSAPAIGDATDDSLFPLDSGDVGGSAALRELYRALYDPTLPPARADHPCVERAFWLLGGSLAPESKGAIVPAMWLAFPDGGYDLFLEASGSSRLLFRSGPGSGVDVFGGHMHADLLSIYLWLDGRPIAVEAGTYTYRSSGQSWPTDAPPWRRYFLGSHAHNGPSVENVDPLGTPEGDFRSKEVLSRVVRTVAKESNALTWVEAEVTGVTAYNGYRRGVVHARGNFWMIYDLPPSHLCPESLTIGLQFAPDAKVELGDGHSMCVRNADADLWIAASDGLTPGRVACGARAPLAGWISPRYGELIAAPRLEFGYNRGSSPAAMVLLRSRDARSVFQLETVEGAAAGLSARFTAGNEVDYLLLNPGAECLTIESWGMRFTGALLWARCYAGTPVAVHWLSGQLFEWEPYGIQVRAQNGLGELDLQTVDGRPRVPPAFTGSVTVKWM